MQKDIIINDTYQIIGRLGSGGGGTVYKAYHLRLKKYVVLKRINDSWLNLMDTRAEVDTIKGLKHAYLPQAYDYIRDGDNIYTVIDFVEGQSFDKYIEQGYTFMQQQLIFWTKQLCEALIYLHSQNPKIIHSDIKPANIMLTPQGNICLIDFNVSLSSTPNSVISATSTGYASPEQYMNIRPLNQPEPGKQFVPQYNFGMSVPLDERSDIYSLGATLYHMMTLQRPPEKAEERIPLTSMEINFSETFINIVEKMLQYDPNDRYQNAEQILKDLNNIKKIDKSYVKYRRTQIAANIIFAAVLTGAVLLSIGGKITMDKEYVDSYERKISYADNYLQKSDYDKAIDYYNEAKEMFPENIAPYYGVLHTYSEQYNFDKVIEYANDTLTQHEFTVSDTNTEKEKADFYYIVANAYFEQEEYKDAVKYYKKAAELNAQNPEYYRDYAIACARLSDIESAKEILETAKELNLTTDSIDLVNAEIAYAEQKYTDSVKFFKSAISESSSDTLTQRAYLYMARAYQKLNDYESVIDVLTEKENVFNSARLKVAKKFVAEAYLYKAQNTSSEDDKSEFCNKAIDLYKQIEKMGNVSKETKFNLAMAYELAEDLSSAEQILLSLTDEYPNDSNIYAKLALLEADKQGKLETTSRNYDKFKEYYDKAEELNKKNKVSGTSGVDISEMEKIMQQLKENNWIKGL